MIFIIRLYYRYSLQNYYYAAAWKDCVAWINLLRHPLVLRDDHSNYTVINSSAVPQQLKMAQDKSFLSFAKPLKFKFKRKLLFHINGKRIISPYYKLESPCLTGGRPQYPVCPLKMASQNQSDHRNCPWVANFGVEMNLNGSTGEGYFKRSSAAIQLPSTK